MTPSKRTPRLAAAAYLAGAATLTVWLACRPAAPALPHDPGLSVPQEIRILTARMEAQRRVIVRLLDGEMGLLEAAAWFRRFNENPPDQPFDFRRHLPGDSDGEKLCRQVIAWTHTNAEARYGRGESDRITARLESELSDLLAEGGPVRLPW